MREGGLESPHHGHWYLKPGSVNNNNGLSPITSTQPVEREFYSVMCAGLVGPRCEILRRKMASKRVISVVRHDKEVAPRQQWLSELLWCGPLRGSARHGEAMEINQDFSDLFAALNANGVEYLVVGAHALAAPGHVRATLSG